VLAIVIITISRVPPRRNDDPRKVRATAEVLAKPITFLRTAVQRGRPPPRDYGYTRLPTLVRSTGVAVVADVPTFAGIPAHDFRYGHARVAVCCRRYLRRYTYLSTFDFRLPLNQERSDRRLVREHSTREGASKMPEVLLEEGFVDGEYFEGDNITFDE